jgi:hypothetical protein
MFLIGFEDNECLFIEHGVWIAPLARHHDDDASLDVMFLSPGDRLAPTGHYLATVPGHVQSARIAPFEVLLMHHGSSFYA